MIKVYTSAVVIIPPVEKWAPIQEIRKIHDRQINRWMPHITLLYPFRPEDDYPPLEREFSEKCISIKPFKIKLKQFNYFNHGRQRYTLWLNPEPIDVISNFQATILKIVPDCNDVNKYKNGFRPHLSVGQIKGKSNLMEIKKNLQERWKEITFLLNEIFFISREKSKASRFEIKKRIQLKKE
ncbi:MAG: 2'-5' RNA ligase family protein [Promethearchaeota archaeon]|nr:MAG: 2'-5' RNA ligase family protein [Candidatus Lokiarchaeota archaeon]